MLVTTVISGTPLPTSQGHASSLLQFIMVLASDTENVIYFCSLLNRHLKYIIKVEEKKEGHFLFNDALNTFLVWFYGIRHTVKDHSYSERGNPMPPHGMLFPISSKGSFISMTPNTR